MPLARATPHHQSAGSQKDIVAQSSQHKADCQAYLKALRINPEYADAWNNLGIAYFLSGNQTAALETVKELRPLDPAMADRLFNGIAQTAGSG